MYIDVLGFRRLKCTFRSPVRHQLLLIRFSPSILHLLLSLFTLAIMALENVATLRIDWSDRC